MNSEYDDEFTPLEEFILKTVGPQNMQSEVANRMREAFHKEVVQMKTEVKAVEDSALRDAYLKEMIAARGNLVMITGIKQKYNALGLDVF